MVPSSSKRSAAPVTSVDDDLDEKRQKRCEKEDVEGKEEDLGKSVEKQEDSIQLLANVNATAAAAFAAAKNASTKLDIINNRRMTNGTTTNSNIKPNSAPQETIDNGTIPQVRGAYAQREEFLSQLEKDGEVTFEGIKNDGKLETLKLYERNYVTFSDE